MKRPWVGAVLFSLIYSILLSAFVAFIFKLSFIIGVLIFIFSFISVTYGIFLSMVGKDD